MKTVESLTSFLSIVKNLRGSCASPWYRGIEGSTFSVQPGLYRRGIGADEYSLVSQFLSMAPQYASNREALPLLNDVAADWQWYFLMQHFGMPTRLLDWTENPLVALYFALRKFASASPPATIPTVWVMNPSELNRRSVGDDSIIVPGGSFTRHWLFRLSEEHEGVRCHPGETHEFRYGEEGKETDYDNAAPLAIYPVRRNRRIVAQLGVFTVHGADRRGLEKVLGSADRLEDVATKMVRIKIRRASAPAILEDLEHLGIHELALFPELSHLADHLRRTNSVDVEAAPKRQVKGRPAGEGAKLGVKKKVKRKVAKRRVKKKVKRKVAKRSVKKKVKRKVAKRRVKKKAS